MSATTSQPHDLRDAAPWEIPSQSCSRDERRKKPGLLAGRRRLVGDLPDRQRQKVYESEWKYHVDPPPGEMAFTDVGDTEEWLSILISTKEFSDVFPAYAKRHSYEPVVCKESKATRSLGGAYVNVNVMSLTSRHDGQGMTLPVVTHELAHLVTETEEWDAGTERIAAHGPEFVANHLDIVSLVCGSAIADKLVEHYEKNNVAIGNRKVTEKQDGLIFSGSVVPTPSRKYSHDLAAVKEKEETHYRQVLQRWRTTGNQVPTKFVVRNLASLQLFKSLNYKLPARLLQELQGIETSKVFEKAVGCQLTQENRKQLAEGWEYDIPEEVFAEYYEEQSHWRDKETAKARARYLRKCLKNIDREWGIIERFSEHKNRDPEVEKVKLMLRNWNNIQEMRSTSNVSIPDHILHEIQAMENSGVLFNYAGINLAYGKNTPDSYFWRATINDYVILKHLKAKKREADYEKEEANTIATLPYEHPGINMKAAAAQMPQESNNRHVNICGIWMPRAKTRCVLVQGHAGVHRSIKP